MCIIVLKRYKYTMHSSKQVKAAVRKRAQQRWWALMHRVETSNGMRDHLGDTAWASFKGFCIAHFKHGFLALFDPASGILQCSGPICGGQCPHNHTADLSTPAALDQLGALHLDHAHDVQHICEMWKLLTPHEPVSWDQGIKGMVVAHLLFGSSDLGGSPPNIRLRCGISRSMSLHTGDAPLCHKQHGAHYTHVLRLGDIRDVPMPKRALAGALGRDQRVAKRQRTDDELCEIEVIVID